MDENNYRVVDDGEPSGSAGKPIYSQILGFQITNTLVIVIRYFGGVLLGIPGLINAYKTATNIALQENILIEKSVEVIYKISFDYTIMNDVMKLLKYYQVEIINQELNLFCIISCALPVVEEKNIIDKMSKLIGIEIVKISI